MNHSIINRRKSVIFAALAAFVFLFAAQSLTAQTAQRKFKEGDEIPMGGGWTYRIVECRIKPGTRLEECDYIPMHDEGSTRDIRTESVFDLRRYVQQNEAEKKRQDILNKINRTKNQTTPPTEDASAETTVATAPPTEVPSEDVELTVTALQLNNDYTNNETAAMKKYVDKIVRVTGAIVYYVSSNGIAVKPTKAYLGSSIQCQIEDAAQLETLNKDETITIIGMPRGGMLSTGVSFLPCRVERKTAAQIVKPEPVKKTVKAVGTANGKVVGTWYYTTLINADGTEKKLSSSESYLWLKDDGSYENRFGAVGQIGTFTSSANKLTLNRENVGAKTYTMTITGTTMTLKSGAGGYKLEKE